MKKQHKCPVPPAANPERISTWYCDRCQQRCDYNSATQKFYRVILGPQPDSSRWAGVYGDEGNPWRRDYWTH